MFNWYRKHKYTGMLMETNFFSKAYQSSFDSSVSTMQ